MRCVLFFDPLFGSERFIEFDPSWVVGLEEGIKRLFPFKKYPVTNVTLKDGRRYMLAGHVAADIRAAQQQETRRTP